VNSSETTLEGRLLVVAGGGHFGVRAAKHAKESHARVAIVDINPKCAAAEYADRTLWAHEKRALDIPKGSAVLFIQDAVDFILDLLRLTTPDYIVPAVPGHLAGRVVEKCLKCKGFCPSSASSAARRIASALPQGIVLNTDEANGIIVTSYMQRDLVCRVPCSQPGDRCPTTGRVKAGPMHHVLSKALVGNVDLSRVLVSRLVSSEAGCFRGADLASFLADAGHFNPPYTLAIATSCECHGVLNLFSVSKA